MTVFSLVLMFVLADIILKNKKTIDLYCSLFALATALEMMMSVGYFINIHGVELGYSEVVIVIVTLLAGVLLHQNGKMNVERMITGVFLIFTCIISLVLQMLVPYKGGVVAYEAQWDQVYFLGHSVSAIQIGATHVKEILHLICFVLSMRVIYQLEPSRLNKVVFGVFEYSKYFVWFGIIEFGIVYMLGAKDFLYGLEAMAFGDSFFNNSGTVSMGISSRLRGLKSEPSMWGYALFLFIILALILYLREKKKKFLYYAIIAGALEIASLSMTAIVCTAALFFFYYMYQIYRRGTKKKIVLMTVFLALVAVMLILLSYVYMEDSSNYFLHRLHLTLLNFDNLSMSGWNGDYAGTDASTRIRLLSIAGEFEYWQQRPLFGLALGSTYAHSPFMTILASIGLVGMIFWFKFIFYPVGKGGRKFTAMKIGWCAMLIFAGAGLFPFYGFQNIIIYYALLGMSQEIKYEKNKSLRRIFTPVSCDRI